MVKCLPHRLDDPDLIHSTLVKMPSFAVSLFIPVLSKLRHEDLRGLMASQPSQTNKLKVQQRPYPEK